MIWNMFLDDERFPPNDGREWVTCRTKMDVISAIFEHNKTAPTFSSWDHDLGRDEPTGHDIAKWIVDMHIDRVISIPKNFTFYVHSQNPVGRDNIYGLLNNYLASIRNCK